MRNIYIGLLNLLNLGNLEIKNRDQSIRNQTRDTTNNKSTDRFEAENKDKRKERLYISLSQFSKNPVRKRISSITRKKPLRLVVDVVRSVRANIAWRKNKARGERSGTLVLIVRMTQRPNRPYYSLNNEQLRTSVEVIDGRLTKPRVVTRGRKLLRFFLLLFFPFPPLFSFRSRTGNGVSPFRSVQRFIVRQEDP